MAPPTDDAARRRTCLSKALKTVRRHRGVRPLDMAAAMGMPLRSYEYFESARGRLNLERLHRFAEILDADPYAILIAVEIGSWAFAVRCIDNKLLTVMTMALQDFDAGAQDEISKLDAATLIGAFTRLFDELTKVARDRDAFAARWMAEKALPGQTPETEE